MVNCTNCGEVEYVGYFKNGESFCPKCKEIGILDKFESLKIVNKQCEDMEMALINHLKKFDKDRLLVWVFNEREKNPANFINGIPSIELDKFLSMSYIIKKVMEIPKEIMGDLEADDSNTKTLIDLFVFFLNFLSRRHSIEEGFSVYGRRKNSGKILEDFIPLYNDSWKIILDSFSDHLILSHSEGEKYLEENKEKYQKVLDEKPTPESFTPKETIEKLFSTLLTFRVALRKNKEFGEVFNLDYLKKLMVSPDRLLIFIKEAFPNTDDLIHRTDKNSFLHLIEKYFPILRKEKIYKGLVFSENNQSIFPLFLELNGYVFTSRSFVKVMCIFYYSTFHKQLFDSELSRQGRLFEDEEFQEKLNYLNFKHVSDILDNTKRSTLQIDNIV